MLPNGWNGEPSPVPKWMKQERKLFQKILIGFVSGAI